MKFAIFTAGLSVLLWGCSSSEKDKDNLQGTWEMKEAMGGFWFGLNLYRMDDSERISFEGDKFTAFTKNSPPDKRKTGTYKLEGTANPKKIDFLIGEKPILGIYRLSGNHLTICIGKTDDHRPTIFESGFDRPTIIKLERIPPQK